MGERVCSTIIWIGTSMLLYVSTSLGAEHESIQCFSMDGGNGALEPHSTLAVLNRPTFIIAHPTLPIIYSVADGDDGEGVVAALPLNREDGGFLQPHHTLEQQPSGGQSPCHLSINAHGSVLCVANYGSGTFSTLELTAQGGFAQRGQRFSFIGVGTHPIRQTGSHIHASIFSPSERHVLATDLGLDRLVRFRSTGGQHPRLHIDGMIETPDGSGPRHLRFADDGRFLYVVLELSNEVAVYRWHEENGEAHLLQVISTLPPEHDRSVQHTASEIHISRSGHHLWVANRGDGSIVRYTRERETGLLGEAQHFLCDGRLPRHFTVDETGRWMAIANTDTNAVVLCSIDPQTGRILSKVHHAAVEKPMCVLFAPKPGATRMCAETRTPL